MLSECSDELEEIVAKSHNKYRNNGSLSFDFNFISNPSQKKEIMGALRHALDLIMNSFCHLHDLHIFSYIATGIIEAKFRTVIRNHLLIHPSMISIFQEELIKLLTCSNTLKDNDLVYENQSGKLVYQVRNGQFVHLSHKNMLVFELKNPLKENLKNKLGIETDE